MKTVVVDASVLMEALLHEQSVVAQRLELLLTQAQTKKFCLSAPTFLKVEFANGIRFKLRDPHSLTQVWDAFSKLPIAYQEPDPILLKQVILMSRQYETTVYDTLYHLVALTQEATFITCDARYYRKAEGLGNIELWSNQDDSRP